MKVPIECPKFRAYLQEIIPAAFGAEGLMDTQHKTVKNKKRINIELLGASSLAGIEHFGKLRRLDADNNPNIKHLPKLPSTLKEFWSNHKFDTSVQPVFFYSAWNFVLLDNGCVIGPASWNSLDNGCVIGPASWNSLDEFKAWIAEFEVERKFAKFISECEQYLKTINHVQ